MPPIPESEKLNALVAVKERFYGDLDRLAENLYRGRITLGMWEEDMRTRLRIYLVNAGVIGMGDVDMMTQSDWGRIGQHLRQQYQWLHRFAQDIYDRREDITIAAIQARAHLYAEAAGKIATDIQAGDLRDQLSHLPGDGSTTCLNQCGCRWTVTGSEPDNDLGVKSVAYTWVMDPVKEHCEPRYGLDGCTQRAGITETVIVPIDEEVPSFIGLGGW